MKIIDARSNDLGLEQLADYAEQRLAPTDETRVVDHLTACAACQLFRGEQPAQLVRLALVLALALFVFAISYVALSGWRASQSQAAVTSLISGDVQVRNAARETTVLCGRNSAVAFP